MRWNTGRANEWYDAYDLNGVAALPTEHFSNSVLAGADAPLLFLGDIFVLPRPFPLANVFSIGDVLIAEGLARRYVCGATGCSPRGSWC